MKGWRVGWLKAGETRAKKKLGFVIANDKPQWLILLAGIVCS